MKRSSRGVSVTAVLVAILLVVVVGFGAYYVWTENRGEEYQTLVAKKGDFLQQVSISGKVVAAQSVDLSFVQGGRVTKVNAKVNEEVEEGDVLAETENADLSANYLQKQAILESQQAALRSLQNGARPEDIAVTESGVLAAKISVTQARQALIEAIYDAYSTVEDTVRTKVDIFIQNPRGTSPQLFFSTSNTQLEDTVESERIAIETMLTSWKAILPNLSSDVDPSVAVAMVQGYIAQASSFLGTTNLAVNLGVPSGAITQTMLASYATGVATGRDIVNTALISFTTAVTAEKAAISALATAEKNLTLKKAGPVQADIDAQAAQVKAARAVVEDAKAQLQKTYIEAPFDGVVTAVDAKVGQIAQANTPQISMNSKGAFQIEAFIPEINISLINLGDIAEVTLDAYGENERFPTKVVSIDPAETVRDGVSTYRAVLEFVKPDARVKAGMTANVTVTTDEKSGVISIPQNIVTLRDGKRFVPVLMGKTVVEREVTVGGVSSLGTIEILSGLNEGDSVVILSP